MKSVASILFGGLLMLLIDGALVPKNLTAGNKPNKLANSLVYRIIPVNSSIPNGSKFINIEVELWNTSQRTVRLTPIGIGSIVSFASVPCSISDYMRSSITTADMAPSVRATKVISILPGGSYRQIMKLELNPKFFTPGMYTLSMDFSGSAGGVKNVYTGDLESNEVFFEIAEPESPATNMPQSNEPR